ncbi:hypothetical protein K466DRAFT_588151 [Polyporus arcularius HHB13444]|uniref:DUF6697 domain-containing protein n=1 Tax=Polyporus arcularius HHB13444 TaxID=1314778 RepID=A0A5C3P793_9APHY|nr:hypothetical protein K466DRAFT_588151 [Polyporus arcularius HHB13444]
MSVVSMTDDHQDRMAMDYEMVIRLERLRVQEALNARDVAVDRLASACASVREKTSAVDNLREEKERLQDQLNVLGSKDRGEVDKENRSVTVETAGREDCVVPEPLKSIEDRFALLQVDDVGLGGWNGGMAFNLKIPSTYEFEAPQAAYTPTSDVLRDASNAAVNHPPPPQSPFDALSPPGLDTPDSPWTPFEGSRQVTLPTLNTSEKIEARYSVLASLPLPSGVPEDSLTPVLIPPPYTLHDFIGTTSGLLRYQLGNYRVFQQSTTTWCPDREEHGYYLAPLFKCSTNPRVTTAHRWAADDVDATLDIPTECFFNKDGKWYYAGIYKPFRLEDLCSQEWECLSTETSSALIKETLAARKNTSPQNIYETSQLYSAGALKVACIGLQCIGFNNTLYRGLLEHAALCTHTGKWRMPTGGYNSNISPSPGLGLASPAAGGTTWSGPGSPANPMLSPPQVQAANVGVGVIGRPPTSQPPTPTYRILQHGAHEFSANCGERLSGAT